MYMYIYIYIYMLAPPPWHPTFQALERGLVKTRLIIASRLALAAMQDARVI